MVSDMKVAERVARWSEMIVGWNDTKPLLSRHAGLILKAKSFVLLKINLLILIQLYTGFIKELWELCHTSGFQ